MVKIGDKVQRQCVKINGDSQKFLTGRVVYIHPEYRYHTVRFEVPGGTIDESYQGV